MTFSAAMMQAMNAQETGEVFLDLLELDHPSFDAPVRLVRDNMDVDHQGAVYSAMQFDVVLPERSSEGGIPTIRLAMQNVDRAIIQKIRSIANEDAITVRLKSVLRSEPDRIQREYPDMDLRKVPYTAAQITGEVVLAPIMERSISKVKFTPSDFAGLF